jgi:hypothetical protein
MATWIRRQDSRPSESTISPGGVEYTDSFATTPRAGLDVLIEAARRRFPTISRHREIRDQRRLPACLG